MSVNIGEYMCFWLWSGATQIPAPPLSQETSGFFQRALTVFSALLIPPRKREAPAAADASFSSSEGSNETGVRVISLGDATGELGGRFNNVLSLARAIFRSFSAQVSLFKRSVCSSNALITSCWGAFPTRLDSPLCARLPNQC